MKDKTSFKISKLPVWIKIFPFLFYNLFQKILLPITNVKKERSRCSLQKHLYVVGSDTQIYLNQYAEARKNLKFIFCIPNDCIQSVSNIQNTLKVDFKEVEFCAKKPRNL